MNKITPPDFNYLTLAAYILAFIFIIFIIHSARKVLQKNRKIKNALKLQKDYELREKELRSKGFKRFSFNQGKNIVWAPDFKSANSHFQTDRKNGN